MFQIQSKCKTWSVIGHYYLFVYIQIMFIFSKSFDIDMCPLPFTLEKMYCFISERFTDPSAYVQEQALQWLQV